MHPSELREGITCGIDEAMTNSRSYRDRAALPSTAAHPKESTQLDELSEVEFMSFLTLLNDDDCGGVLCEADEPYPGIAVEKNASMLKDVPHTGQAPGMVTKSGAHGQHDQGAQPSCAHKQTADTLCTLTSACNPPAVTAVQPTLEKLLTHNEPAWNPGSVPATDAPHSSKLPNSSHIVRERPQNELEVVKLAAVEPEGSHVHVASTPGMFLDTRVETKEERRARMKREKNKRNQQAFRERCRIQIEDLQKKLLAATKSLSQKKCEQKRLQGEQSALTHRLRTLATLMHTEREDTVEPVTDSDAITSSGKRQTHTDKSADAVSSGVQRRPHMSEPSTVAARSSQSSSQRERDARGPKRSIEDYSHHVLISYSELEKHLIHRRLWKTCPFDFMMQAIKEYQMEAAEKRSVSVDAICWYCLSPSACKQVPITFSAGILTPECSLSASLCMAATSIECLFLAAQHDILAADDTDACSPCITHKMSDLNTADELDTVPLTPPESAMLTQFSVRCGMHGKFPVGLAVSQVVEPLIRKYKHILPDKHCRHLCMKVMNALYKTTKGLESEGGNRSNDDQVADDDACNPCTLTWSNLGTAMLAMKRHMICIMNDTLNEDAPIAQGNKAVLPKLEEVQSRMHEVNASVGVCSHMYMQCAPVVSRRILASQCLGHGFHNVSVQRLQMKLYKHLQFEHHQKASLAVRWKSWCRRRHLLDSRLNSAILQLQNLMEASQHISGAALGIVGSVMHDEACTVTPKTPSDEQKHDEHAVEEVSGFSVGYRHCKTDAASLRNSGHTENSRLEQCASNDRERSAHAKMWPTHSRNGAVKDVDALADPVESRLGEDNEDPREKDHDTRKRGNVADLQKWSAEKDSFQFFLKPKATSMVVDPSIVPSVIEEPSVGTHNHGGWRSVSHERECETTASSKLLVRRFTNLPRGFELKQCSHDVGCRVMYWEHGEGRCPFGGSGAILQASTEASKDDSQSLPKGSCSFNGVQQHLVSSASEGPFNFMAGEQALGMKAERGACACATCKDCCREGCGMTALLGESGDAMHVAQEALRSISDVHKSDELMHYEFLVPFWELTEVQHCRLTSSHVQFGVPSPEVMQIFKTAAEDVRHAELFGTLSEAYL